MTTTNGIDPRGPRFGASVTATLLLVDVFISVPLSSSPVDVQAPGYVLLVIIAAVFLWGAIGGVTNHPYAIFFKKFVRPKLQAPAFVENPAGPTFAQAVGFVVTIAGVVAYLLGASAGIVIAASVAFVAAFLNAVFGYCLGCEMYLLFAKRGITFGLEKARTPRSTGPSNDPTI